LPTGTFLKIWTERLYPKLDAYQALTDNSIDEASLLFTDPEHFAAVVGKGLTQEVISRVSNQSGLSPIRLMHLILAHTQNK